MAPPANWIDRGRVAGLGGPLSDEEHALAASILKGADGWRIHPRTGDEQRR